MATLDGFQAYPCGMTAQHAVEALWNAHGINETLKSYTKIIESNNLIFIQISVFIKIMQKNDVIIKLFLISKLKL